jgi:hypothetical protein
LTPFLDFFFAVWGLAVRIAFYPQPTPEFNINVDRVASLRQFVSLHFGISGE